MAGKITNELMNLQEKSLFIIFQTKKNTVSVTFIGCGSSLFILLDKEIHKIPNNGYDY